MADKAVFGKRGEAPRLSLAETGRLTAEPFHLSASVLTLLWCHGAAVDLGAKQSGPPETMPQRARVTRCIDRTTLAISSAARAGWSCSQTLMTVQSASIRRVLVSASRSRLR